MILFKRPGRSPERVVMFALSEMLSIPHHDCSGGGTVEKEFLVDVARALGVSAPEAKTKDTLLHESHALLYGSPMPSACLSKGETVTNAALMRLVQGVRNTSATRGAAKAKPTREIEIAIKTAVAGSQAKTVAALGPVPDEDGLSPDRKMSWTYGVVRFGQKRFRDRLLNHYASQCVITGSTEPRTLDAAHVSPFASGGTHHLSNGLLLRTDVHRLWDAGLIAIHESRYTVLVSTLLASGPYADLAERPALIPRELRGEKQRERLQRQREWCRL